MTQFADDLVGQSTRWESLNYDARARFARHCAELEHEPAATIDRLVARLHDEAVAGTLVNDTPVEAMMLAVERRQRRHTASATAALSPESLSRILLLYHALDHSARSRGRCLALVALSDDPLWLARMADAMAGDPPTDPDAGPVALAPLFQRTVVAMSAVFPRLLDALASPHLAAAVLDLGSSFLRRGLVDRHPATAHAPQLADLLGQLVHRLESIDERPDRWATAAATDPRGDAAGQLSRRVADIVSLVVSLCDTVALVGDTPAAAKLRQAMELPHRRIQTEAAAGLARLGDDAGTTKLVALAAEPVARLRVLNYAVELGILDRIDSEFQTPQSRAEAELALALAQPSHFGLPPTQCDLVDARRLFWPGYEDPVDCYLFRFQYEMGQARFSNIGIAGPLAHTFIADLEDLPPDDIYAIFAGWHAEHDEIFELGMEHLNPAQRRIAEQLARSLDDSEFQKLHPVKLANFLGQWALVAEAELDGRPGTVIADQHQAQWQGRGTNRRPLGPSEAYWIYKGRRLLKSFNG